VDVLDQGKELMSDWFSGTAPKVYLNVYSDWNRLAVQSRGPELPTLYCQYCLLIQSHPQWLKDANVNRSACCIDHHAQDRSPFNVTGLSLFGVLWILRVDSFGLSNRPSRRNRGF
jgi:hypothetical protein